MTHLAARRAQGAHRLTGFLVILIFVLRTAAAQQAITQVAGVASTPPAAKTYAPGDIQTETSRVYMRVDKTGFGHVHGVAGMLSGGRVTLDAPKDAGEMTFDMRSFVADVGYARKYVGLEDESSPSTQREVTINMLGPDVLDVKRYPTAIYRIESTLKIASVRSPTSAAYRFIGQLTLHDVTRPVSFDAQVEQRGEWLRIRGKFPLVQSQFGIKPLSKALGAIGVADEMTVWGDVWIKTDGASQ